MRTPTKLKPDKSRTLLVLIISSLLFLLLLGKDGLIAGITILFIIGTIWSIRTHYQLFDTRDQLDFDKNAVYIVGTFVLILLGFGLVLLLRWM